MTTSIKLKRTVLVLALSSIYPVLASASAGVAQFIAGDVNVRGADGKTDALLKGRDIESGQAIVTSANGRAQVKFTDGGLISLQPNTEFKIVNYIDKADPQQDRFLVDLLRGSMRAITGLIGKRNRANYKVTTTTATIGIRGSGFSAGYNPDGSLGVTAEKDAIEVCSGGTCVGVVAGESVRVNSSNEAPVRTVNRASVPTPGQAQEVATVGNQSNADGKAAIVPKEPAKAAVTAATTVTTVVPPVVTGTFTNMEVRSVYDASVGGATFALASPTTPTVINAGGVTSFTNANAVFSTLATNSSASAGTIAGNDFIGWGRWTSANRQNISPVTNTTLNNLHYVAGIPSAALPMTGSMTYSFLGGTTPTLYTGSSGTLNSASFFVDFAATTVDTTINTSFGSASATGMFISSGAFANGSGSIKGFFSGPNGARAGLVYSGFSSSAQGYFSGAAVFQKP